jgi:hypothetical protein
MCSPFLSAGRCLCITLFAIFWIIIAALVVGILHFMNGYYPLGPHNIPGPPIVNSNVLSNKKMFAQVGSCMVGGICYYSYDEATCAEKEGVYSPDTSCPLGACVSAEGDTCTENYQEDCINNGETYLGDNLICNTIRGACCNYATNECNTATNVDNCNNNIGGQFIYGPSSCPANPPEPYEITAGFCKGSCCFQDGSCQMGGSLGCPAAGGTFKAGGTCNPNTCPPLKSCVSEDNTQCEDNVNMFECTSRNGYSISGTSTCASLIGSGCDTTTMTCASGTNSQYPVQFLYPVSGNGFPICPAQSEPPFPITYGYCQGACCLPGTPEPVCQNGGAEGCSGNGGVFHLGENCITYKCPVAPVTGSCCNTDGSCAVTEQTQCSGTSTWTVNGVCTPNTCPQPPQTGACCVASTGTCYSDYTSTQCQEKGGNFGLGQTCTNTFCPAIGSCCKSGDYNCYSLSENDCTSQQGSWSSQTCGTGTCGTPPPVGACCKSNDYSCYDVTEATCAGVSGVWTNTPCIPGFCGIAPVKTGACCMANNHKCLIMTTTNCTNSKGKYLGDDSRCSSCRGACCDSKTHRCEVIELSAHPKCTGQKDFNYGKTCEEACAFGACCKNNKCIYGKQSDCKGTFIIGTQCGTNTCTNLNKIVTCCTREGHKLLCGQNMQKTACLKFGGTVMGVNVTCNSQTCSYMNILRCRNGNCN